MSRQKSVTKKGKKNALRKPDVIGEGLNVQQELFCRLYTQNSSLFGNATQSYAEAYGYKLEDLPTKPIITYKVVNGRKKKILGPSEREKAENVCGVEGNRMLRNPKVNTRVTDLLNEYLKDHVVDGEISWVILQREDLPSKVAMIREYNKLRKRTTDRLDLTSAGEKLESIGHEQITRIARRALAGDKSSKA